MRSTTESHPDVPVALAINRAPKSVVIHAAQQTRQLEPTRSYFKPFRKLAHRLGSSHPVGGRSRIPGLLNRTIPVSGVNALQSVYTGPDHSTVPALSFTSICVS